MPIGTPDQLFLQFAEASASRLHNSDVPGGLDAERDFAGLGYRVQFPLTDVFLSVDWLHLHQDAGGVSQTGDQPARKAFKYSIMYLFILFGALAVDHWLL